MLEFFKLAEATRNPQYKDLSFTQLMRDAAEEAGWYLEFVPNLQNSNKYQVRYKQPFSSQVTAELACRLKTPIMYFISKRDIDPSTIDSYLAYGFWNFIKTYKPESHNTDEKIKAAIYRSVQNKVDQGNRKERFRYRPTTASAEIQTQFNVEVGVTETEEGTETKVSTKYIRTPKEVSFNTEIFGKDGGQSGELGDFIPDERFSPSEAIMNEAEEEEVIEEYTSTKIQEVLIRIALEAGAHGRLPLKTLQSEANNSKTIREEVVQEIEISIHRAKERAAKKGIELEDLHITQKMVEDKINRKTKVFFRELKSKLKEKYSSRFSN